MKKEKKIKKKSWRRLDNSAKIFPIISNKRFSTVFRLSVVLKEDIKKDELTRALNLTLKKYDTFKVREKHGLFWYYFEDNTRKVKVEKEKRYPCKTIDKVTNGKYLFKVTYFEKKINLEVFHSLTDGNTATEFIKDLTRNYIDIINGEEKERVCEEKTSKLFEDSYLKNYDKMAYEKQKQKKAYIMKGRKLSLGAVGVTHGFLTIEEIKNVSKKYNATITEYISAKIIEAIINKKYKKTTFNNSEYISMCIPVNLKKYFDSETLLNFFTCAYIEDNVSSYLEKKKEIDKLICENGNKDEITRIKKEMFIQIVSDVKEEFERKINPKAIKTRVAQDVKTGNNFAIRILPLILKKATIQLSYDEIRKFTTMTLSNIGNITLEDEYSKYVDKFLFLLAPEKAEKIKCAVCSFNNELVISFTSVFRDNDLELEFFNLLKEDNIKIEMEGNGVYNVIS